MRTFFPFGPPIGHAELPKEMIDDLNKGCDKIAKDKELSKSEDWSQNLVGNVEQETLIPKDILNKWGNWFATQVKAYIAQYLAQMYIPEQQLFKTDMSYEQLVKNVGAKTSITVQSAWYVRSFVGDYNPIHTHTDCELTCVGFLKIPDWSKEAKKENKLFSDSGNLQLISNSGGDNARHFFENDTIRFLPKVGNWYLFPSNIRHQVYPFSSKSERRSFSINMSTNRFERPGEPSK